MNLLVNSCNDISTCQLDRDCWKTTSLLKHTSLKSQIQIQKRDPTLLKHQGPVSNRCFRLVWSVRPPCLTCPLICLSARFRLAQSASSSRTRDGRRTPSLRSRPPKRNFLPPKTSRWPQGPHVRQVTSGLMCDWKSDRASVGKDSLWFRISRFLSVKSVYFIDSCAQFESYRGKTSSRLESFHFLTFDPLKMALKF